MEKNLLRLAEVENSKRPSVPNNSLNGELVPESEQVAERGSRQTEGMLGSANLTWMTCSGMSKNVEETASFSRSVTVLRLIPCTWLRKRGDSVVDWTRIFPSFVRNHS